MYSKHKTILQKGQHNEESAKNKKQNNTHKIMRT
jgi:hypothetical protein